MEVVAIKAESRDNLGKTGSKQVRKEGLVPGVIYSTEGNTHFSVPTLSLRPLVYTPQFKVAEIEVDGKSHKCILKDVQFHPQTDEIVHVDMMALEDGRTIKVEVPLRLEGVAPGVATGGKLYQKMRKAKIKTLTENLVDHLTLDISGLELGDSIRVRDIKEVDGVKVMNSPGIPVASVEIPRALRSAQSAEAAAGAAGAQMDEAEEGGESEESGEE